MAGGAYRPAEGGGGGATPSIVLRNETQQRQTAQWLITRRRKLGAPRGAFLSGPTTTTTTPVVVHRADLVNTGAALGAECIFTINADGDIRVYTGLLDPLSALDFGGTPDRVLGTDNLGDPALHRIGYGEKVASGLNTTVVSVIENGNPVRTVGTSSTAEATLTTLSVPPLGTNGAARFEIHADVVSNPGAAGSFTVRVKLGASTAWGDIIGTLTASANLRTLVITGCVIARASAGLQRVSGTITMGDASAGSVAGFGNFGTAGPINSFHGDVSEDLSTAKNLVVTVQFGTNDASNAVRLYDARLVLVPGV